MVCKSLCTYAASVSSIRKRAAALLASIGLLSIAAAQPGVDSVARLDFPIADGPFEPTWESIAANHPGTPEWFREAKFGVWIHWGPQAAGRSNDWYAKHLYLEDHPAAANHRKNFGHPSEFGYMDVLNQWRTPEFNAQRYMRMFHDAGFRYAVIMGVHHDNFDLWDSKHQPWNSVNVGPKQDLLGAWAKAAREVGIRYGVSFHHEYTWWWWQPAFGSDTNGDKQGVPYDGVLTAADGKGQWWDGLDPQQLYGRPLEGYPEYEPVHLIAHGREGIFHKHLPYAEQYATQWAQRIQDAVEQHDPDFIYTDGNSAQPFSGKKMVDSADYLQWASRYGATTSITIQSATAVYGAVSIVTNGGVAKLAYTSPANFVGTDVVTYTLRDPASGRTLSQTLVVQAPGSDFATNPTVAAKLASQALVVTDNLAPRIVYGAYPSYTSGVGQTLTASNLLSGFTDAVDQPVARLVEGPKHGSLKLRYDGSFEYKPNPGFTGVDVFRYEAFDGRHATQAVATIRVLSDAGLVSERLYQVAIAMLTYHDTNLRFPIASNATYFDAQGQPYLSWRVHLLPFLGYEDLYAQFRLNESWNSAHNLPLLSQMPDIYRAVGDSAGSVMTRLQTFTGPDAPFGVAAAGADQIGPRLSSFNDGANNTILFIATGASAAVQWTKPDDIEFNPLNPLAGLGMSAGDVLYAMTADAQLVPLSASVAPEDIAALVTPDGEEVIDAGSIVREYLDANPEVSPELFYRQDREQTYLKQIALAALNHNDVNSRFPVSGTSNFDDNGNPYLSWRVHLLPYLGHEALYNRFVLTEPWDSPNNLPLLAEMPDIFRSAEDSFDSMTTRIVTFNGSGAPFGDRAPGVDQIGPRFSEILDGASNTILFAEAAPASAVLWTKPDDIAFNPADPLNGVATGEEIRVVFFDGSYHKIPSDVQPEDFVGLVTHRGSEVVNLAAIESSNGFAEKSHNKRLNDLKQLVLALHNYESSRTRLPIDIAATDGSPLLSWRVAILPYLEQQALYNQFRRDEPWDSPHNLALLDKMPDVFRGIDDPVDSTTTTVMHFTGAGTPYTVGTNGVPVAPRFSNIQDGTSRTIAFVEAGAENAIPWTKPGDLSLDPENPFSTLGDLGESFIAAFFDGHIETLSSKISLGLLKAYITPSGGESTTAPPTVTASVGLTVLESAGNTKTNEVGVDVFHVILDRQPTGDVIVNLATSNAAVAMVDRATLRFTPSNWNKPQPVALRGVDNQAVNLDRVVQVVVAVAPALSAAEYDLLPPTIFTATITDDEPRTPELSGDYNNDGAVDAADYTVWRDAGGVAGVRPFSGADGNGDSRVDALDHAIWVANYGTTASLAATLVGSPDVAAESDAETALSYNVVPVTHRRRDPLVRKLSWPEPVQGSVAADTALLLYLGLSSNLASDGLIDVSSIDGDLRFEPDPIHALSQQPFSLEFQNTDAFRSH